MFDQSSVLDAIAVVDEAITSRRSVRAFLPTSVSPELVVEILTLAARAPSGTNIQPWRVHVLGPVKIEEVFRSVEASGIPPERAPWDDYRYYPERFVEPFLSHRRALGEKLYSCLGITRRDVQAKRDQFMKNYRFFGAPVGLLFTLDRELETGSYLDLGMFMQNIMIAARARGLDTCPQAAFAPYHHQIRQVVSLLDNEVLVCGMALGYRDKDAPENYMKIGRAPPSEWVRFAE